MLSVRSIAKRLFLTMSTGAPCIFPVFLKIYFYWIELFFLAHTFFVCHKHTPKKEIRKEATVI